MQFKKRKSAWDARGNRLGFQRLGQRNLRGLGWLKRLGQLALIGLVAFTLICVAPLARAVVVCRILNPAEESEPPAATPPEAVENAISRLDGYQRREDSTYLKLPEWYIVYSAEEYAAFIKNNPPSQFPYFAAVGQFWESYYSLCAATVDRYSYNNEDQVVNMVIGVSFAAEYYAKGAYEVTLGRLSEWLSGNAQTEEDVFAQKVAAEYGTFLHTIPWYDFPFAERLGEMWRTTGWWGPNVLRKWERKFTLTAEYSVKALYGWVIGGSARASFVQPLLITYAWAENLPEAARDVPEVEVTAEFGEDGVILALPRYEGFAVATPQLAAAGVHFVQIAGNDDVMLTVLAPRTWNYDLSAGEVLFTQPILTNSDLQRLALNVPVNELHTVLNELAEREFTLEHIYDY
jgi:hypothetical protein